MTLPAGYIDYFKNWEEKIGAFIEFAPEKGRAVSKTASQLSGLPFAVKDNIAVKDLSLTCGSKLLADFTAPYTATAVRKLEEAGAAVIGKTNLDEFGMGSSTDNSSIKRTNNPWDTDRVAGGSSGGSAAAVAAGLVPFALGSDTGGSVRQPAAFCGIVGLKPTWGAISRYGLVAYASSLDTIGVLAGSVKRCRAVFDCAKGADPLDQTSRTPPNEPAARNKVIGVLSPSAIARVIADNFPGEAAKAAVLEPEMERAFETAKENLKKMGYDLVEVEINGLKYGVPAYYTIAAAEASANLARFDGIRYGKRPDWAENPDELIDKSRDMGLGDEVKLRILLGTFVLRSGFQDRYYIRAQRIRVAIRRGFEEHLGSFSKNDGGAKCAAILMPVFPVRAFRHGGAGALTSFAQKAADLYTCCANLAGLPALAFPTAVEGGLPTGVQLLGRPFAEETLFSIAEKYETAHPFPHPQGFKAFWEQT
ncbi:MAG: Asp-tRNA(Asn)/Glu-tRNA(Gln) amidotransferase subunit GatA [Spirochaetaceae bacterium]|jgi:aspartyl-tRNA(Asn)/glutamyl-tRNA(Gln) amidotransferase subunit A|nr:Asp-tRNA(Asn)/Glu-tRNA(Gln) amidotransferase subunit GatA [Spirochaetaceae bacterium]